MPRLKLVLLVAACSMLGATGLVAQEKSDSGSTRIIKLRSTAKPSARKEKKLHVPNALVADPKSVSFDKIGSDNDPVIPVPEALQSPKAIAKPAPTKRVPKADTSRMSPRVAKVQPTAYAAQRSNTKAITHSSDHSPVSARGNRSVSRSAPALTAEIVAPNFINVNQVAKMTINVRNTGNIELQNVRLLTSLPEHARFESSNPKPMAANGLRYEFSIATIGPNQTRQITIDLVPTKKLPLEIGTDVLVENRHSIAVGVREPVLKLHVEGPQQVSVGDVVEHVVTIENSGDGIAEAVRLEAELPDALRFTNQTGMEVAKSLAPGQSRKVIIKSIAQTAGIIDLSFMAAAKAVKSDVSPAKLKIHQPELNVSLAGPRMNFVNRDGIYSIRLDNSGEVPVSNVKVELEIPIGMKITTINRPAKSDDQKQTLTWNFDRVAAATTELIQLKAIATKPGQQIYQVEVSSRETLAKRFELATNVATRAEMSMHVRNQTGPVQVGEKAEFAIVIENRGSREADNVTVRVELPDTLMPVKQDGVTVDEFNRSFLFTKPSLAAGQLHEFNFSAVGAAGGEFVVRSVMENSNSQPNVIAEDTIYVYEVDEFRVSEALSPNVNR